MTAPEETLDPPPTRRDAVTETFHGTEIAVPYRWLEVDDAARAWIDAQNEYADAHLQTATREGPGPRLRERAVVAEHGPLEVAGGRYFGTVGDAADDHGRVIVRDAPGGEGAVVGLEMRP